MSEKFTPAIYALNKLHAELGGRIKENKREALRLRANMKHVEAVMKLLDPAVNVAAIAARRKYHVNPLFRRGRLFAEIARVLRGADHPLTALEIAGQLIQLHRMAMDEGQKRAFASNITKALKRYARDAIGDGARPQRWQIIGAADRRQP